MLASDFASLIQSGVKNPMHYTKLSEKHAAFYIFDILSHCALTPCLSYREVEENWMELKLDKSRQPLL